MLSQLGRWFGGSSSSSKPEARRRRIAKSRRMLFEGLEERRVLAARLDINGAGANWTAAITDQAGDNTSVNIRYVAGGAQWEFFNFGGNFSYFINGVAQTGSNTVFSNIALTSITANLADGSDGMIVYASSTLSGNDLNFPAATSLFINLGAAGENNSLLVDQNGGTTFGVTGPASGTFGPNGTFSGVDSLGSFYSTPDTFNISGAFAGTIQGRGGNDTFRILNGGSAANIDGGAGTDLLIDENTNAAFTIGTGGANGSSTGATSFTDIDNLQGGATTNTFTFNAGSKWNGGIDGAGGTDTINVVALGPVNVNPLSPSSGNILATTDTPPTSSILNAAGLTAFGSGYVNVENVLAAGTLSAAIVAGNLVVTDTAGVTNTITVRRNGLNIEITDASQQFIAAPAPGWTLSNNNRTLSIAASIFSGQINLNTLVGDDTAIVDISTGAVNLVNFNGGAGGNDTLRLIGGTNPTLNYAATQTFPGEFDGNAVANGVTVATFAGLSPVFWTNVAGVLTFNLPNLVNPDAVVSYNAGLNSIVLTGSTFETTTVSLAGITSVVVNGNANRDTITVDPTYTAARPPLDINGAGDIDNITVSAGAQARNINGGNGNNNIFVSGTVAGTITTGNGADTIIVQATGVVNGLIDSGDENDLVILRGTEAGIRLGNGNDTLRVESGTAGAIQTGDAGNNDTGSLPVPFNRVEIFAGATAASITGASVGSAILINDSIQIDGTVTGAVNTLGGADDIAIGTTGLVGGNIDMGAENDRISIAGTVNGGVIGGAGNDRMTIVGNATVGAVINLTGANSGNYTNPVDVAATAFSQIEALLGTNGSNDTFNISNAATLGGFIDGQGGDDTVSFAGYSAGVTVNIIGVNQFNVPGVLNIDPVAVAQFDAADPEDRTIGAANIENLTGSTFNDTFNLSANGRLTGATGISGGANVGSAPGDTINATFPGGTVFNVTGAAGTGNLRDATLADVAANRTNFTLIESLNGGSAVGDIFNILPGGFIQNLSGLNAAGCDLLHIATTAANSSVTTVNVARGGTGPNAVTINGVAAVGTFADIERIIGDAGNDRFVFTGLTASLESGVDGAGGEDTLDFAGYSRAITVNVNGVNAGDVLDPTLTPASFLNRGIICPPAIPNAFANVENIIGTADADTFNFDGTDRLTGTVGVNGNGPAATLPFIGADFTTPIQLGDRINVAYAGGTRADINGPVAGTPQGTINNVALSVGATNFTNVEILSTNGGNDIVNVGAAGQIAQILTNGGNDTVTNNGTVGRIDLGAGVDILNLAGTVVNVLGGTENDTFNVGQTGTITGTLDGGTQTGQPADVLNVERNNAGVGAFFFINDANAGTVGTGRLAPNQTDVVNNYINIENLNGGTGNDTFIVDLQPNATPGSLSGGINGQAGVNTLETISNGVNGANYDVTGANQGQLRNFTYNYPANAKTPVAGTLILNTGTLAPAANPRGFTNIQNLLGGSGDDWFQFRAAGQIDGWVDGAGSSPANAAGNVPRGDILDLQLKNAGSVQAAVADIGAIDGYNGTATTTSGTAPFNNGLADQFRNINAIFGSGAGSVFTNATIQDSYTHVDDETNNYDAQFRLGGPTTRILQLLCFDNFVGGDGNDIVGVESLEAGHPITVTAGNGADALYLGTPWNITTDSVENLYNTRTGDLDNVRSVVDYIGGNDGDQVFADDSNSTAGWWYDVNENTVKNSDFTYDFKGNPTNPSAGPAGRQYAAVTYQGVFTVNVAGSQFANNFYVTPSANVTYNIDGNEPLPGGADFDYLCVDFTGLALKQLLNWNSTTGSGTWDFGVQAGSVNFVNIEKLKYFEILVSGADAGVNADGTVRVYDADTGVLLIPAIDAFPGLKGGVRVASGDLNGDGIPEIIAAPGVGVAPRVLIYSLVEDAGTGLAAGSLLQTVTPRLTGGDAATNRGLSVAVGDINGDRRGDLIVGATRGNADVRVFYGQPGVAGAVAVTPSVSFTAFGTTGFQGGAWVGAGNTQNLTIDPRTANDPIAKRDEILVGMGTGVLRGTTTGGLVYVYGMNAANTVASQLTTINAFNGANWGAFVTTAYLAPSESTLPLRDIDTRATVIVSMQQGGNALDGAFNNRQGGWVAIYAQPNANAVNYLAQTPLRIRPFTGPGKPGQATHSGVRAQARFIPNAVGDAAQFFFSQGQDGRPENGTVVNRYFGVRVGGRLTGLNPADLVFAAAAINTDAASKPRAGGTVSGLFLG